MWWESPSSFKMVIAAFGGLLISPGPAFAQSPTLPATVEFSQSQYTARADASIVNISLRRAGNTNIAVSVNFTTADEAGTAENYYAPKTGTVSFPPGAVEESIPIRLLRNADEDATRVVKLTLNIPTNAVAVLGPRSTAALIIRRNAAWLNFGLNQVQVLQLTLFDIPLWQYLASLIYIFLAFYISKLLDFFIRGRLRQWVR